MNNFAEECVLGAAMLDNHDAMLVVDALAPEMFGNALHRAIYQAVADLYWAGEAVDPVTLLKRFPDQREYLVRLAETASVNRHLGDYIRVLQEEWQAGLLADSMVQIQAGGGDVTRKLDRLEELLSQHRQLLAGRGDGGATSFTKAFAAFTQWIKERGGARPTGFGGLDLLTGGLLPGAVFTVAARPGGGKTDFALNLAMKAAASGARVLYFSMEMTTLQLMQRVASKLLSINSARIRDRSLTQDEERSLDRVMDSVSKMERLLFFEKPRVSLGEVRRQAELWKPELVVIDHIGLMERPNARDPYKALGMVSNGLKQLALGQKLTVLQLAQMNRQVEARKGGKPCLSDLRESGDLEQDSDFVGFLSPQLAEGQELYGQDAADVFLHLLKNRHGRAGRMEFKWQPQYHSYTEVEKRYGP